MRYLSVEEVLAIHDYQIERFGGTHGLLSLSLLESSISRPNTNIAGTDMYKSVQEKGAVLACSIIKNHPFLDGNKRTGLHAALTFMELNGYKITISQRALIDLGISVANNKADLENVVNVFTKNSVHM